MGMATRTNRWTVLAVVCLGWATGFCRLPAQPATLGAELLRRGEAGDRADLVSGQTGEDGIQRIPLLPPGPDNPRNSEGDFIPLRDGRLAFLYTHFTGGAGDHSVAHLAARFSADGGRTWTPDDVVILPNEADQNVMSVSLLRLPDERIALFYLRKNSLSDCRPFLRISSDELGSWSRPAAIVPDDAKGYYVLNNDRCVQLSSGRIVVPLAMHQGRGLEKWTPKAQILCYLSDDNGRTWQRGDQARPALDSAGKPVTLQEPGVVELSDGRLMIFCRTDAGSQFVAHSGDGGRTWSDLEPSNIPSPLSPASIERIPGNARLLLVWNNHAHVDEQRRGKRTPFNAAVSRDDGLTWQNVLTLESNPHGWYCYTAIEFVGDHLLLGHCAGDRRHNNGLAATQITRIPLSQLEN